MTRQCSSENHPGLGRRAGSGDGGGARLRPPGRAKADCGSGNRGEAKRPCGPGGGPMGVLLVSSPAAELAPALVPRLRHWRPPARPGGWCWRPPASTGAARAYAPPGKLDLISKQRPRSPGRLARPQHALHRKWRRLNLVFKQRASPLRLADRPDQHGQSGGWVFDAVAIRKTAALKSPRPLWACSATGPADGAGGGGGPARCGGVPGNGGHQRELRVGGDTDLPPLLFSDAAGKPSLRHGPVNKRHPRRSWPRPWGPGP